MQGSLGWLVAVVIMTACQRPAGKDPAHASESQRSTSANVVPLPTEASVFAASPADLPRLTRGATLTVVVFFSAHCPCQRAHDEKLRELAATYEPQGVRFLLIDSEASSSLTNDAAEARQRQYPFAILSDPAGQWAEKFGAVYATYTVILDPALRARYHGGIDSDQARTTATAEPYVRNALTDLLHGAEPRVSHGKTLGCSLRRR